MPTDYSSSASDTNGFLSGGGEMGTIIRSYDWAETPVGPMETWPQSLRTTLSIIINSKFPMFLFWGENLICFYNDAYRPSLGNDGKHPSAIGKPGAEVWPEIWPFIKPLIDQVLNIGIATWNEDQLLPIFRNGKMEDVYWTFSYSPVNDESGKPGGVFVTCTETTKTVQNLQKLELSEQRFHNFVREANVGIVILSGYEMRVELSNERYGMLINSTPDELQGQHLFEIIPDAEAFYRPLLENVIETGESLYLYDTPYSVNVKGEQIDGFLDLVYQPYKERDGAITGVIAIAYDVTEKIIAEKKIAEREQQLASVVESAPFPIGVYVGHELRIILANQSMLDTWGKGNNVVGLNYTDILPELQNQEIFEQLREVLATGTPFHAKNTQVDLVINGELRPYYFNYSFTPLYDNDGKVYGVMNTAAEVTDLNLARKVSEESALFARNIIANSVVAQIVWIGSEMTISIVNEKMLEMLGRDSSIIGKTFMEAVPEFKDTPLMQRLEEVLKTGEPFTAPEEKFTLIRYGEPYTGYYSYTYQALTNAADEHYGVICTATEITAQVLARKKIEEAEERARLAIQSAELGIYITNLKTDHIQTSDRFNTIWGVTSVMDRSQVAQRIHPDDRQARLEAHKTALKTGHLNYEARIIHEDQSEHWIKVKGKILYDEAGAPETILGVIQDITEQKEFAEQLTRLVKQRTNELKRSNDDLLQFAHVASHDLKEPVRKIKFFSTMLDDEFAALLPEKGKTYLSKIQNATDRMFAMIEGVLNYSTFTSSEQPIEQIDLNEIIAHIENDLEVLIVMKKGIIKRTELPSIEGASVLIYQLFYNMINNALKFSKSDVPSVISISATVEKIEGNEFAKIIISDNGIGLDPEYVRQIFNPFTRLHPKDRYEGTGLGLALCKKIAERHHGTISADGKHGEGAVFTILLPLKQPERII